jgi:hypothetical protein
MEDPLVNDGVGGMVLELSEGMSRVFALRCVSQRPTGCGSEKKPYWDSRADLSCSFSSRSSRIRESLISRALC